MKFVYKGSKAPLIIAHERNLLKAYSETAYRYSDLFEQHSCSLDVGLFWINSLTKEQSIQRLPFCNGYACYVYCDILRKGKEVCVRCTDCEADYYPLSVSWAASSIDRSFLREEVSLYSEDNNANDDLMTLLTLLSGN